MKNMAIAILLTALVSSGVFAEETSDASSEEIGETLYRDAAFIPSIARRADCAGIGLFLNVPSPTTPTVDIQVQQWWTPPLGTNTVRIHELNPNSTNWVFPTNVPVVFFALEKRQLYVGHPAFVIPEAYPPEWVYSITNATEMAKLVFPGGDRAWFRVTRDNGLPYAFATNLWECMRTNPNPTNYYEVLRDAERTVSMQNSWRVHLDAYQGLSWLFDDASESYLAEKLNDPLLSPIMKNSIGNRLRHRFGWTFTVIDDTVHWHPPQ